MTKRFIQAGAVALAAAAVGAAIAFGDVGGLAAAEGQSGWQQANLDIPGLTEDRYTNGSWNRPQTPGSLPRTAGKCGKATSALCR